MLIGHGQANVDEEKPAQSTLRLPASIDPRLADFLVCPKTKGALEYDASTNELISRRGGLAFPIRDGIMVLDSTRRLGTS